MNNFKVKFPEQAEGTAAKTLEKDIRAAAFAETEGGLLDFGAFHVRVVKRGFHFFPGLLSSDMFIGKKGKYYVILIVSTRHLKILVTALLT